MDTMCKTKKETAASGKPDYKFFPICSVYKYTLHKEGIKKKKSILQSETEQIRHDLRDILTSYRST